MKILKRPTLEERFLANVEEKENYFDECWNWTGVKNSRGYGLAHRNYTTINAHRVSYILYRGEVPEGWDVHHICRNRGCVNPNHLEALPHSENMKYRTYRGIYWKKNTSKESLVN